MHSQLNRYAFTISHDNCNDHIAFATLSACSFATEVETTEAGGPLVRCRGLRRSSTRGYFAHPVVFRCNKVAVKSRHLFCSENGKSFFS